MPISKPFVPSEIDRVAAAKSVTQYAPVYLDLGSGGPRLQPVIERLKSIGPVLLLAICKVGPGRAPWACARWAGFVLCESTVAPGRRERIS